MKIPQLLVLIISVTSNLLAQQNSNGMNSIKHNDTDSDSLFVEVDKYIESEMKSQNIPGIAVAVLRDGDIILAKGYGYSNIEHQVPVKSETIFQSGSIGKAFTVMAILMLAEEGKLSIDDKVNKYLDDAPKAWDEITIRHLLQHTSGLGGYPENLNMRADYTEQDFYNLFKNLPLEFRPGEKRGYSNVGFSILGMVIGKVTGKFYGEYLKDRIFIPLQMNTARVISEEDIVHNRAAGYRLVDGELKNQEWVSPSNNSDAAGALYMSILDIAKWENALNSRKLLTDESYDAMWSPLITKDGVEQTFGFSWHINELNGKKIIGHSGGWQGFNGNFSRYPEQKLAVILFTNLRGVDPIQLSHGVQEIFAPELSISKAPSIIITKPKIDAMVKRLVESIRTGKIDYEKLVFPAVTDLRAYAEQAASEFKSYGALKKLELINRDENNPSRRWYYYRLIYNEKQLILSVGINKDDKIYDLKVRRF